MVLSKMGISVTAITGKTDKADYLKDLGAKVFSIGVKPNGLNINYNCGSTFPEILRKYVKKFRADLGIATKPNASVGSRGVVLCAR